MSKVPCLQCGAQILPNTAERNTGLCMPCKNSLEYKVSVEPEKQKAREQRALELIDPWRKLWQDLTDRVQNTVQGFGGLSDPEKKYFAVGLLDREVLSSGFTHFLSKNPDTYYKYAMLGLKEMGAINAENCLQRAKVGVLKFGDILERKVQRGFVWVFFRIIGTLRSFSIGYSMVLNSSVKGNVDEACAHLV